MSNLIVVRGIPGSGKSSFSNTMFPGTIHLENDMFHYRNGEYLFDYRNLRKAIKLCNDTAETWISCGCDVVVSNTFTKRSFVEAYRQIAEKHKANFVVYRMMGEFQNIHNVPKDVLENMKNGFEEYPKEILVFPTVDEDLKPTYSFRYT